MNQSEEHIELPEMPLPPQPPPEEDPITEEVSAVEWPAMEEFAGQKQAFSWAYYQTKAGGPKYFVHKIDDGKWEAIQLWMSNL